VFYVVATRPLLTVSARHVISQGIALCGGRNVFADAPGLVPPVSPEAVVAAAPEAIVMASTDGDRSGLARWARFPEMPAVRDGHLFTVQADLVSRPGPRLLDGIDRLCAAIDAARRDAFQP